MEHSLGTELLRLHPEGEELVLTLSPLPQLKPGIPLPSPEDLRGKILIKNKKNQFSGPASPSKEPGGEAEGDCPPSASVGEGTGEAAWEGVCGRGSIWRGREGLGLEGMYGVPRPQCSWSCVWQRGLVKKEQSRRRKRWKRRRSREA